MRVKMDIVTTQFDEKLNAYKEAANKAWPEVIKEEARLLAEKLQRLCPPKSQSLGKKLVRIDIGKVYLSESWFEEKFQFRNERLQERVKNCVLQRDKAALDAIFIKSNNLSKIHIEGFNPSLHQQGRINGHIHYKQPYSFPLGSEGLVKSYVKKVEAAVGTIKAGWAACVSKLGGKAPSKWLDKPGTGEVEEHLTDSNPYIIIRNKVSYAKRIHDSMDLMGRAVNGRKAALAGKLKRVLEEAKQASNI